MDEVVFEKYGFAAYNRSLGPSVSGIAVHPYHDHMDGSSFFNFINVPMSFRPDHPAAPLACLAHRNDLGHKWGDPFAIVVDSGYSHTHVIPIWNDKPILHAVRRVNVGGKLLTNFLKQVVSYRSFNMMDEVHLINDVKEKLCYVSMDFNRDLQRAQQARSPIAREFILPNGSTQFVGQVKVSPSSIQAEDIVRPVCVCCGDILFFFLLLFFDEQERGAPSQEDEQVLVMNNERFSIPEVLLNPNMIGIEQAGIAEAIVQAINACPEVSPRASSSPPPRP